MRRVDSALPDWDRVLATVAHPDDESFGLGAVIDAFVDRGAKVTVLCLTHGEASTLHGFDGDLSAVRAGELADAGRVLGVTGIHLLDYPDGGLAGVDLAELSAQVLAHAQASSAQGVLTFDDTGITGHPDHIRATHAAIQAARRAGFGVLAWTLPQDVAEQLSGELSVDFRGRASTQIDICIDVNRSLQRQAVMCHPSQAVPGSALWRRLELLGDREHLRWLVRP